jgi:hypothetical protein
MKKKPYHHHLKRVIHPNRYFIWALIIVIFGGLYLTMNIVLQGYQIGSEAEFTELVSGKVYVNQKEGYSLKYPRGWSIDPSSSTGTVVFIDPTDPTESVTILATDLNSESLIRRSLKITQESKAYETDGMTVVVMQAVRDGEEIEAAIFKTARRLYYISGNADAFSTFVTHFQALKR